jgi:predicted Zn-dependent protease
MWTKVCNLQFVEVFKAEGATIIITMRDYPGDDYSTILGKSTYPNNEGQPQYIWLNSLRKWVVASHKYAGLLDVRPTLRHESGHNIGLEHPLKATSKDIMNKKVQKSLVVPSPREVILVVKMYGPPLRKKQ